MECVICIDNIEERDLFTIDSCKHAFHQSCILEWRKQKNECPICRSVITPGIQENTVITTGNVATGRMVVHRFFICLSVSMLSNVLLGLYLNSTTIILWILATILSLKSPALLKIFSLSGFIIFVLLFYDLIKYIIDQKNMYDSDQYSSQQSFSSNLFWYILSNTVLLNFVIIQSYCMYALEASISRTHIIQQI